MKFWDTLWYSERLNLLLIYFSLTSVLYFLFAFWMNGACFSCLYYLLLPSLIVKIRLSFCIWIFLHGWCPYYLCPYYLCPYYIVVFPMNFGYIKREGMKEKSLLVLCFSLNSFLRIKWAFFKKCFRNLLGLIWHIYYTWVDTILSLYTPPSPTSCTQRTHIRLGLAHKQPSFLEHGFIKLVFNLLSVYTCKTLASSKITPWYVCCTLKMFE